MNCFTMTAEISKPPKKLNIFAPKEVDITRSSYIMAAIDRLVHHSIILDMMSVESYRAEVASLQHLSSARPKKSSSSHASHDETVVSLQGADASSGSLLHPPGRRHRQVYLSLMLHRHLYLSLRMPQETHSVATSHRHI